MEPPESQDGNAIRDAKADVLRRIGAIDLDKDVLLGQYDGYANDPTIENKDTNCPTFAAIHCRVNTPRWQGVPFIVQAGKAMSERRCEVRIRLKDPKTKQSLNRVVKHLCPNEIVMTLQPDPKLQMENNVKTPGLSGYPMQASMELNYGSLLAQQRDAGMSDPDAYSRLLLDVLRGRQASFVRDDELLLSWEIFTPLLHRIERDSVRPLPYKYGSNGPETELQQWIESVAGERSATSAVSPSAQESLGIQSSL